MGNNGVFDIEKWKKCLELDARAQYCMSHSVRSQPYLVKLQNKTFAERLDYSQLGSPEVSQMCQNLIQSIGAKRIIDIGTYSGASALAFASTMPPDGHVITTDISDEAFRWIGMPTIRDAGLEQMVEFKHQSALQTLDELIADPQQLESFDFVFINADKENYCNYYERSIKLLRPGGILAIDNALCNNWVFHPKYKIDSTVQEVDTMNKKIHNDTRVNCNLLPIGDGLMLVFKK